MARWVGIVIIAEVIAFFFGIGYYFMPAFWRDVEFVIGGSTSAMFLGVVGLLELMSRYIGWAGTYVSVPLCFLWVHVCWPTPAWDERPRSRRYLEVLSKVGVVTGAGTPVAFPVAAARAAIDSSRNVTSQSPS